MGGGFLISAVTGILLFYDWVSFHFRVVVYQPPERYPFHSSTLYTSSMFNGEHEGHTYADMHENPMEVHSIPFQDEDLKPLKTRPISSDFSMQWYKTHLEDPVVATVCRKQSRISTIHEQIVHLSFHRIKFLARAVITPQVNSQYGCANLYRMSVW